MVLKSKPMPITPKIGLIKFIQSIKSDYQIFNKELFDNLDLYMQNKPNVYDNRKGLLFIGGVGSGKTELMKLLSKYGHKVGLIMNVLDFEVENKSDFLQYYTDGLNLVLDDIGSESNISFSYGNKFNIVEAIILRYYQRAFQNGYYFCGTTNLTTKQLNENYSERVIDRLKEMVNIVPIINKSFRK